ncbi:MAG: hypothetical protein CMD62_05335 [Gammaproteobacteria bacterium]|nr:hypothetical protein [Gammaproteobacteria bacterium]
MTTAAENQNWQKRQYDSYGPHFRIETANPELGVCGNIAYNLYGYADSGDTSNLGLKGNGQFDIFADQCITIDGGAKVEGGGVCVNIIGSRGDIAITAMDNGDVRIKGRNIIIDADENIEMLAGGKVSIDSAEIEAVNQNTTRINAKRTFVSGKSIDIGGSTGVVLKTNKGTIKVNKFISADQSWASKVVQGLVCAASLPKYMK